MKKINIILIGLLASLFISNVALALSLNDAKQQGLVGEQVTGYLGTVKATSATTALVTTSIRSAKRNIKRSQNVTVQGWRRSKN